MSEKLIPERLKYAREKLNITMTEAAKRLNLSKIGYCRYEYGDRSPSLQTIEVIARCFNTSVNYLIGKTDDITPDTITISKAENPELFLLINEFRNFDDETLKRLTAYYRNLKEKHDR